MGKGEDMAECGEGPWAPCVDGLDWCRCLEVDLREAFLPTPPFLLPRAIAILSAFWIVLWWKLYLHKDFHTAVASARSKQCLLLAFRSPPTRSAKPREELSQLAARFGGQLLDVFTLDDLRSQFYVGDADGAGVMMDNQALNDDLPPIPKLVKRQ